VRSDGGMGCRLALVAVLLVVAACTDEAAPAADPTTTTTCAPRVDRLDVAYVEGGDPQRRLDLYQPPGAGCAAVPVVMWVHGGAWRAGDKTNAIEPKVRLWTEAGWAVASVDYRLTDVRTPERERVMAPSHNEDVAAAVAWLATESAGLGLDPERVALLGYSAGAGIAAAVTSDPAYLAEHDLGPSAVACAAPLDTEAFDITEVVESGGPAAELYRSVFGDEPAIWEALSPLTHVGEAPIPDLFLVRRGAPSRRTQVDAFADAARQAGTDVTVVDLPGFTHEQVNKRIGDPDDDVLTPALQAFLTECLAPSAAG
jgi:arylformamidase